MEMALCTLSLAWVLPIHARVQYINQMYGACYANVVMRACVLVNCTDLNMQLLGAGLREPPYCSGSALLVP